MRRLEGELLEDC